MIDPTILQRNDHPIRYEAATHLFTAGQIVRLKGGFGLQSQSADTYRITGTLPREEIHNNIASGTTTNVTNAW